MDEKADKDKLLRFGAAGRRPPHPRLPCGGGRELVKAIRRTEVEKVFWPFVGQVSGNDNQRAAVSKIGGTRLNGIGCCS